MRTFITWSGEISRGVALELSEFLRLLFPTVEPFVSSRDIRKGTEWRSAIGAALTASQRGIICLTPGNYSELWVLCDAGALSMSLERPVLYTVLIGDIDPDGLQGSPLSAFQHTRLNREDMKNLVKSINEELEHKRTDQELDKVFETFWPDFDAKVSKLITLNVLAKRVIRIVDFAYDSSIIAGRVFRDVVIPVLLFSPFWSIALLEGALSALRDRTRCFAALEQLGDWGHRCDAVRF